MLTLDTQVQEELSAEVVALSDAVLALLQDCGHVEASDLTEEVILEATEMILFAAMNCAHVVELRTRCHRQCPPRPV
jgi:hypothetical protein